MASGRVSPGKFSKQRQREFESGSRSLIAFSWVLRRERERGKGRDPCDIVMHANRGDWEIGSVLSVLKGLRNKVLYF